MRRFKTVADCGEEFIKEWATEANNGLQPDEVSAHSRMNAYWMLPSGQLYQEQIFLKTKEKMFDNNNHLPHLLKEFDYKKNAHLQLTDFPTHSNQKVWWICNNSHSFKSIIKNRTRGTGCPFCTGKRVNSHNNLCIKYPILATEWHPYKNGETLPTKTTTGSSLKVWWKCSNNHEWMSIVNNRKAGRNCPICSKK